MPYQSSATQIWEDWGSQRLSNLLKVTEPWAPQPGPSPGQPDSKIPTWNLWLAAFPRQSVRHLVALKGDEEEVDKCGLKGVTVSGHPVRRLY